MDHKKQVDKGVDGMDNMQYWDKLKRPPESALKTIKGGRLKGMTDISPQWRLQIMTEVFGPVGIGWTFEIIDRWEKEAAGEIAVFVQVAARFKRGDSWSEPIPGIGGSKILATEKNGSHFSDEAYKMALTDALSVALKTIGVAADIYLGLFDGSKYVEPKGSGPKKTEITVGDISYVSQQIQTLGIDKAKFLEYLELNALDDMMPFHFEKALKGLKMKAETLKNENAAE